MESWLKSSTPARHCNKVSWGILEEGVGHVLNPVCTGLRNPGV
jgi:hypothetical protein